MACTLVHEARGYNPRRGDEFYVPLLQSGTIPEHYANDTDELKRYGLFKKSKPNVVKLDTLNLEPVSGITSMSDKHANHSDEWFNMESMNLVSEDLVKLTLGGLIFGGCVDL